MLLHNLPVGETVNLEMVKGSSVFEVTTTVAGKSTEQENAVLLEPFAYKGKTLDLGNRGFDQIKFNLYANDEKQTRMCWRDVSVQLVEVKGRRYYIVRSQTFNSVAVANDRRNHVRVNVEMPGVMTTTWNYENYNVDILDISDNGIAFLCRESIELEGRPCQIQFTEHVNKKEYRLTVDCRCVRKQENEKGFLYGCSVSGASNSMLAYVYIKKILNNA